MVPLKGPHNNRYLFRAHSPFGCELSESSPVDKPSLPCEASFSRRKNRNPIFSRGCSQCYEVKDFRWSSQL